MSTKCVGLSSKFLRRPDLADRTSDADYLTLETTCDTNFEDQKANYSDNRYNLPVTMRTGHLLQAKDRGRRQVLAPKISLSQLLWCMAAVAVFLAMVSAAWRGNLPTFGQSLAIGLLPLVFLVYAFAYWALFAIGTWLDWRLSKWRNGRPKPVNNANQLEPPQ